MDMNVGEKGLYMCVHAFVSVNVGVCVPVCVCHCLAVELMLSMSPSVQEIKQGTELCVSCLIRLG